MKQRHLFLLIAALTLFSCNSISLESTFRQSGYVEDLKELVTRKVITSDERNVLDLYLTVHRNDSTLKGKFYKDVLASAKYDDSVRKKKIALQAELNRSIEIKLLGKYLHVENTEEGVQRTVVVDVSAKNTTDRKIAGFVVHINFRGSDGKRFYANEWSINLSVSAHATATARLSVGEYDNTNEPQMRLAMADLKKITIDYEVSKLLYDDGTVKSISNN